MEIQLFFKACFIRPLSLRAVVHACLHPDNCALRNVTGCLESNETHQEALKLDA